MLTVAVIGRLLGLWTFGQVFKTFFFLFVIIAAGFVILLMIGWLSLLTMETRELDILKERLYSQIPFVGRWLRRRTATRLARLLEAEDDPNVATLLAEAMTQIRDHKMRRIAKEALGNLRSTACIDAVLAVWSETRHWSLTELLVEYQWVASEPAKVQVLSALKNEKLDILKEGGAELVEDTAFACEEEDEEIARNARQVLSQLRHENAKEALCRFVVEHDSPIPLEIALKIGYLPRDTIQRALFLFITEQWERYETLDFDHYLLSTAHRSASPKLRQRIADRLRKAGRTDFLTVLVGTDYYSRASQMTEAETEVMVQMLSDQREWVKLWKLVFEIPFSWSVRILQTLNEHVWQPERGDERAIFDELCALTSDDIMTSEEDARRVLPLALHEATIRVKGRVNDVAFSPITPVIALGTGNRKVGIWNFQQGEMEHIIDGFAHSVGSINFLSDGTPICAERTNKLDDPCGIYLYREHERLLLGRHEGSVTAIEVLNGTQCLSTGRDQKVILWDVPKLQKLQERNLTFWARATTVSPDGKYAALIHEGATVMALPALEDVTHWTGGGVGRCAAFLPDEQTLIIGKYNGTVELYNYLERQSPLTPQRLEQHNGRTQGVVVLPSTSTIVTAGSKGQLHFTNWTNRAMLGTIKLPAGSFTSLHTSPDKTFMVTGDSDASMSLWDLRVLEIPMLFTRPLAQASPDHLITINELATDTNFEPSFRQALTFLQKVLRYRFRFDIEIDEIPAIKAGEFDIEIE